MNTISMPAYTGEQRVTQFRVLRSEWTKLRSLSSTIWSLLTTVTLIVGFGIVYAMVRVTRPPADPSAFDAAGVSLAGVQLAQLAVGVLGVLLITGEFATGSIRVTFASVPDRLPVLWGKAVVFGLTTLVLCVPAVVVAFVAGQSILAAEHLDTRLGDPGVARAVFGSALLLALVGLFGLGLGALLRNTAGGVAALLGLLFAPQILVGFLPESVADQAYRYVPAQAGQAIMFVRPDAATSLSPWAGLGVFALYTAIALGLAAWQLLRRDA
jgi:ABC-type transport system involved in multi-copper enzyme maturation permease subunit